MDIRKRVFTFPKMGEKAYFVAIPTSSGTGSEVTPFAIITDADTGVKWPIADYALLPNMAIVDVDNMMTQPKGLTSASGIDVMTHAIEAYVSIMATDYTDGLAMKAVKLVFENLPSAYENGTNDRRLVKKWQTLPVWLVWHSQMHSLVLTTLWLISLVLSTTCHTVLLTQ